MTNIALFGTVFMDIKGFSVNAYDPVGRNVGMIKFIHGGVGRNVAENLGVLHMPVTFVSTLDDNASGAEVIRRLEQNQINTECVKRVDKAGMGLWMAILDQKGNLVGSISQMPDLNIFEAFVEQQGEAIIAKATHLVVEIDLNEAIARKVIAFAKALGRPVYGIPGNLEVALHHKDLLSDLECFICNDIEAAKIFDVALDLNDVAQFKIELVKFVQLTKVHSMVVTMGDKGAVYYQLGMEEAGYHKVKPVKMVDSTGAGDAFFSGVVSALVKGRTIGEAVQFGARVAAYTIQSEESTCIGFDEEL